MLLYYKQQDAKRKYKQLLAQVNLVYFFDQDQKELQYQVDFQRFIHFYKLLARRIDSEQSNQSVINRLQLWIPDTIVLNNKEMPNYQIIDYIRIQEVMCLERIHPHLKMKSANQLILHLQMNQQLQLKKIIISQYGISGQRYKIGMLQRFAVINKGQFLKQNRFMCYSKFVKNKAMDQKHYLLNNLEKRQESLLLYNNQQRRLLFLDQQSKNRNDKYVTNVNQQNSCTIVNDCREKFVDETVPYVKNLLLTYIYIHLHVTFKEFSADFIKDEVEFGDLLMLKDSSLTKVYRKLYGNLSHIIERKQMKKDNQQFKKKAKVADMCQKQKNCKYEQSYPEQHLQYKMALKMIIQTDKHLYWRGKGLTDLMQLIFIQQSLS